MAIAGNKFPEIQRGNGVANDNLATLRDILVALHSKTDQLENTIETTNKEIGSVKTTIKTIAAKNSLRESWSFYLLIATTFFSLVGILISLFK